MSVREERVKQLESSLDAILAGSRTLAPLLGRDDALADIWAGRAPAGPLIDAAISVGGNLTTLCRTRAAAAVLGPALVPGIADVAMSWVESVASRADLALSPLVTATVAARPQYRQRAAAARLFHGPLFDAVHCLPATWSDEPAIRMRVAQLMWEVGARGLVFPVLGRWVWSRPDVLRALVIEPARGHLGDRVRAARALAALADGFTEDSSPGLARVVYSTTTALFEHADPYVWAPAARGLGRLALGSQSIRLNVFHAVTSERRSTRRRTATAIASLSPSIGAETWVEQQIDRILDDDARRDDPWQVAALAIATPHLARERPEAWRRICDIALATPSLELAWSLAQGLAVLARHASARGWVAEEERVALALHDQLVALKLEAPNEVARRAEALACLERALGKPIGLALNLDLHDARIQADVEGEAAPAPPLPRLAFDEAFAQLADGDALVRAHALAKLRSASRAHAMHLPALALGNDVIAADTEHMTSRCIARLAADACDYGTRVALVGAMTDLVSAHPSDAAGTGHGRASAHALRGLATSQWVRELAAAADSKELRREVQRFRKPLEDLFNTCLAPRPALATRTDGATVPPVIAAWWALCAGPAAVLGPIERPPIASQANAGRAAPPKGGAEVIDDQKKRPATTDLGAAIAELESALHDGRGGVPVAAWGPRAVAALAGLGAKDTALSDVFGRLVAVLERQAKTSADATTVLEALAAAATAMLAVGDDLDEALAQSIWKTSDPGIVWLGGPAPTLMGDLSVSTPTTNPFDQLAPPLRELVMPAVRRLEAIIEMPEPFVAKPGAVFGDYHLIELLGQGGTAEVWRAARGKRPVALKLARTDVPPNIRMLIAAALQAEAENLMQLAFAKVAVFVDGGAINDTPFLATGYIRGRTLQDHLVEDPAADPAREQFALVQRITRDICIGLDNLHCHGLVHRDLKPTNIMLRMHGSDRTPLKSIKDDPQGDEIDEAVLIDFGIAHEFNAAGDRGGTPGYLAPEIAAAKPVGPAADVYALGATLFHVLTRRRLCGDRPVMEALAWHRFTEPFDDRDVRAAVKKLPKPLPEILAAACRLDPDARISVAEIRKGVCGKR